MSRQLILVCEMEQRKEDQLAQQYGQASEALTAEEAKLVGLENYRNEYLQTVNDSGKNGLTSAGFQRLQIFIGQLDKACGQQRDKIQNAKKVVEQRRALWLQQQRKRKSLQQLLDKQAQQAAQKEQLEEQKMLDEFATFKSYRQKAR